jgi:DNA invertase Pin-like site-specific DNA recombinase
MKAVAYFRVSTAAQGRSGLGLDAQRSAVAGLASERNLQVLVSFTEVESGGRNDRPELAKALHHAKITGAILVIAKLDRLSRNAAFLLQLRDSGVRFMAADIPDANDVTIGVLAVIAQAERQAISRRTTEALAAINAKIASGETHVSRRSGRTVRRLGNPNGTTALHAAGLGSVAAQSAVKSYASTRARDLQPTLAQLAERGITTLGKIASSLNDLGVMTPRGGKWHASSVWALRKRLTQL